MSPIRESKTSLATEWTDEQHIDVDRVLNAFGRFPRYNLSLLLLTKMCWYVFCVQVLVMAFIGINPPFYCHQPNGLTNRTDFGKECYVRNELNETISCGTNGTHYVFDSSYGETLASEFSLTCDKSSLVQLGTSAFMFGQLIGTLVVTQLSDHVGRRWPLMLSCWGAAVLGILSAFSPTFTIFVIIRFLMGISGVGVINVGWITATETVSPLTRPLMPMVGNMVWSTTYCLLGVVAMYVTNWRTYCLVMFAPITLTVIMYWLLPETLYWLVAHNKREAAKKWIANAEKYNKIKINLEKFLVVKEEDSRATKRHLGDVFKSKIVLFYVIIFSYISFTGTIVYWGLSLFATNLSHNRYLGFILSGLIEIPAGCLSPLLLLRFGRRTIGTWAFFISGTSLLLLALVPPDTPSALKIMLHLMGKFGNSMMWSATFLLIPEILPTTVRNVSYGVAAFCGKIGSMITPYLALMGESNPSIPPATFGAMSLVACCLHFCLPETRGRQMPEDIKDVDPGPFLRLFINKKQTPSAAKEADVELIPK